MPDDDEVRGRVGGLSGRVGGLSGRVGGLSGRVGGLSGKVGGLSGRVGGLSGKSLEEIHGLMLQDRDSGKVECLERRVDRLEDELLAIAEWLDERLRIIEENMPDDLKRILAIKDENLNDLAATVQDSLDQLDERVTKLEPRSKEKA
jgi:hypothetical protein